MGKILFEAYDKKKIISKNQDGYEKNEILIYEKIVNYEKMAKRKILYDNFYIEKIIIY